MAARSEKVYARARLRRLRRERGLNQVELARRLSISTSYLNQLEHNRRPLTAPVLLRLSSVLGVEPEFFSDADEERLTGELRAALGDEACGVTLGPEEIVEAVREQPELARALVNVHRRYRDAAERSAALAAQGERGERPARLTGALRAPGAPGAGGTSDGEAGTDGGGAVEQFRALGHLPPPGATGSATDAAGGPVATDSTGSAGGTGSTGGATSRPGGAEDPVGAPVPPLPAEPHDEVRDFFYDHRNHFPELERAAEEHAAEVGARPGRDPDALAARLLRRHGVRAVAAEDGGDARRFDPDRGLLHLSPWLTDGQRAFQLATQLALLEEAPLLRSLADAAPLTSRESRELAGIGLATYYAGALLMPYTAFHRDAEELRYDIELLQARYGVGFETVCHRLSTLQRPGMRGVPFSFLRVDRAGNVSKRQSASDFHFSRLGGTCPLWTVYEAFATPGRVLTQAASMPDGKTYFWIARTVTRGGWGHRAPRAEFAVALGCELRHAHRLVYSEGIALDDPRAATPIGLGCRICERRDCAQRARPPAGGRLTVDPHHRTFVPYPVMGGPDHP